MLDPRVALLGLGMTALACRAQEREDQRPPPNTKPSAPLRYVGSATCTPCHTGEAQAWTGSDHDRAMQAAMESTVLGRFDGAAIVRGDETLRFIHEGEDYLVEVTPAGATPRRFPVRYVLGVDPLQQLLLDVGGGRLQALTTAWDTRPAERGGQRWFALGEDANPGDRLHWTGSAYNWNTQCVDCHSTAVERGYDPTRDGFETRFAAEDVGCEACHGPGSDHVAWAEMGAAATEGRTDETDETEQTGRGLVRSPSQPGERRWVLDDGAAIARLATPADRRELDGCAPCHSRRSEIAADGSDYHDRYRLSLLDAPEYFHDGQIREEVFVLGSFLQSKMYAAGVVCSDCHEPHSLELRAASVTETCVGCHRSTSFDTPTHHAHTPGTEAARCESCHMPERVYMGVDGRRDHRFGVPQPEVSARVGAPDPCLACHPDHDASWARAAIERSFAVPGRGTGSAPRWEFATGLWMAREQRVGGREALERIVAESRGPAIVRATALVELGRGDSSTPKLRELIQTAARSPDVLLRRAAAEAARSLPAAECLRVARPLLSDPSRSVRLEAVAALIGVDAREWPLADRSALTAALAEYRASKQHDIDRAEALVDLAMLDLAEGDPERARSRLELALARDPTFTPAYLDLADLERSLGRERAAEAVLRGALAHAAEPALVHFSLGLSLIRLDQRDAALEQLRLGHELAPENARLGYTYAIALLDAGRAEAALEVLERVHQRHPDDVAVLSALVDVGERTGHADVAHNYARKLAELTTR